MQSASINEDPPKRTLLVVDDEEGPRQSLRVVFRGDYNLLMANDGARAIELARQNKIDVCITDIRMAGMSGVELLEQIKGVDAGIEVIMLTAYETVDTLRLAAAPGRLRLPQQTVRYPHHAQGGCQCHGAPLARGRNPQQHPAVAGIAERAP